ARVSLMDFLVRGEAEGAGQQCADVVARTARAEVFGAGGREYLRIGADNGQERDGPSLQARNAVQGPQGPDLLLVRPETPLAVWAGVFEKGEDGQSINVGLLDCGDAYG